MAPTKQPASQSAAGAQPAPDSSQAASADTARSTPWPYSTLLEAIESDQVEKVSIAADGKQVLAIDRDGNRHETLVLPEQLTQLIETLVKHRQILRTATWGRCTAAVTTWAPPQVLAPPCQVQAAMPFDGAHDELLLRLREQRGVGLLHAAAARAVHADACKTLELRPAHDHSLRAETEDPPRFEVIAFEHVYCKGDDNSEILPTGEMVEELSKWNAFFERFKHEGKSGNVRYMKTEFMLWMKTYFPAVKTTNRGTYLYYKGLKRKRA